MKSAAMRAASIRLSPRISAPSSTEAKKRQSREDNERKRRENEERERREAEERERLENERRAAQSANPEWWTESDQNKDDQNKK